MSGRRATTPAIATSASDLQTSELVLFCKSIIPIHARASETRFFISSSRIPWFSRPKATSSSTVALRTDYRDFETYHPPSFPRHFLVLGNHHLSKFLQIQPRVVLSIRYELSLIPTAVTND